MRTKVNDYIDKVMKEAAEQAEQAEEESNTPEEAEGSKQVRFMLNTLSGASANTEQDQDSANNVNPVEQLMKEQLGITPEMQQMFADSIPQLQAQIQQLSAMLQNPSLPPAVRQSTEFQYQQLQHQLQQAHSFAALTAEVQAVAQAAQQQAASFQMAQQQQQQQQQQPELQAQQWGTTPFPIQQPAGQDSAYQRLPVNARRRNMKRDRPSDFLEIGTGGEAQSKMPRFWE
jgi:protein MPE1